MIRILAVEDEKPIADLIYMNLKKAGYYVDCVYDGIDAADKIETHTYDLILLDVMLPGVNGFELMTYIQPLKIPVIFLTAKATVEDKVKGLRAGADDYLSKPFQIVELLARVESVLRRYRLNPEKIVVFDVTVDIGSRLVYRHGEMVRLTKKEYELLLLFIQNKNIALFRDFIYEKIWESDYMGDSRTVDLHVQRLRKKLGFEDKITAVYKVGYRLEIL